MKLGRNTERDYFKQEMLMNNNNKKNRKVSLAKWLSVRLRTKWLWVRVQLQSLKKMQIYNCLQEGLYWLLTSFNNAAIKILTHFCMPAVVYCDENQFEYANGCHRNIIILLKGAKVASYF